MVVLFDFDGTLADTIGIQLDVARDILIGKYGYNFNSREIDCFTKVIKEQSALSALKVINFPLNKYSELLKNVKDRQRKMMKNLEVSSEIKKSLLSIRKIAQLGILSAGNNAYIKPFLVKNGIEEYFTYIYTDELQMGKEKLFKHFLRKTVISPNEIVYVCDEVEDVKICKKFNIKTVAVTWGLNTRAAFEVCKPDQITDKPSQLLKNVEKLKASSKQNNYVRKS